MGLDPIPDAPAAVAETGSCRALVIADYHAGIEQVLRAEGVSLESRSEQRRERLLELLARTRPDRLVVVGDLVHAIGDPWDAERAELEALFDAISVPVTLVKGNHDGAIESFLDADDVTVTTAGGTRLGTIGFAHGHTWPDPEVLQGDVLCIGHEHPVVRMADDVGGSRKARVWLRGPLTLDGIDRYDELAVDCELVVFPAYNDLSGGTWVNVPDQEFLAPFLPTALPDADAYLLDGTRLGAYRSV